MIQVLIIAMCCSNSSLQSSLYLSAIRLPTLPHLCYLVDQTLCPLSRYVLSSQCRCPITAETWNQQVTPIIGDFLCEQFILIIFPTVSTPGSLFSSRHQLPANWAICMRLFWQNLQLPVFRGHTPAEDGNRNCQASQGEAALEGIWWAHPSYFRG